MNPHIEELQIRLEARDIAGFVDTYATEVVNVRGDPQLTRVTQVILPPILRDALRERHVPATVLIQLWRMIRNSTLLVVDNEVLASINAQIDGAFRECHGSDHAPVEKFWLQKNDEHPRQMPLSPSLPASGQASAGPFAVTERVVIASVFTVGLTHVSDMFNCKKNVCASSQEREFLKAVRQYLPNLQAYPNVPLLNFIDIDRMGDTLTDRMKSYVRASRVDVLLCTDDEDPVGGIELDSVHHDSDEARERDVLKNEFFSLAGLPLIRIRPENSRDVRAEDFYDLLLSESESLQALRPRRMRPRRNHDFLVPAESACKVRCQS
ncbi:DUF2726 domain-containing protein [Paraburkholderia susongensis]|uniref:DUF2726 domain-containing protein n=1 Tax=Paraburkholderia susongensis TaxID=1515439 RepID=A0A1X7KET8_9BURK|nr:DUF2726 domain-containing protein [Paraburkholderia susongensis]SMG39421.1 Protein of unknown function [Paraburkholderia susongensis]